MDVLLQLFGVLLLLLGVAVVTVQAASFLIWAIAVGLVILLWMLTFEPAGYGIALAVLAWGAASALGLWPEVRQTLLVQPLWRRLQRDITALSETEKEALEAGVSGWEDVLFAGEADWSKILRSEAVQLNEREQAFLDGPTEALCQALDDWQISTQDFDLPETVWQQLRENRFLGMTLPEEYGGLGFSAPAHSAVVMKIASRSVAAAVTAMVPNSLGPGKLLVHYGTPAQREQYLPRLARGEEIPCFGLTGPRAGSDAASVPDTGVVCRGDSDDDQTLYIRLNWEKRYITLAPVATLIGLAFRLYDPEGLLGGPRDLGMTLALVPAETPGVEIGARHMPMQTPFMNGPIRGRDVVISLDQVIGGRDGVGRGWRMLMECLGEGRAISLPALAVAAAKHVTRRTGAYTAVRAQFGQPIAHFEGVQAALAKIAGNTYLMDAVRLEVARLEEHNECSSVASAIVKQQLTERMRQVVNTAMDLHGGAGICLGPRNTLAGLYQAAPIAITVEGANMLTRNMIIFGQGLMRCHPYLRREMQSLQMEENTATLHVFEQQISAHIGAAARNASRAFLLSFTGGRWPASNAAEPYRFLARQAACFAWVVDVLLMGYGGTLKRRERISARLADMLSAQYMAVCVVRRLSDRKISTQEQALRDWALAECRQHFNQALQNLLDNIENVGLRLLLRFTTQPLGRPEAAHRDTLDQKVAQVITTPTPAREQLCAGIFEDAEGPGALLEEAFAETPELDPIRRAVRRAVRAGRVAVTEQGVNWDQAVSDDVLTPAQVAQLQRAEQRLDDILAVDEYAPGQWPQATVRRWDRAETPKDSEPPDS